MEFTRFPVPDHVADAEGIEAIRKHVGVVLLGRAKIGKAAIPFCS